MSNLTLRSAARMQRSNASGAPDDPLRPLRFGLRFELAVFLLLVATFAAVLFKDSIVDRRFTIDASNIASFARYWYADDTSGGKSTTDGSAADPLHWACEIRPGLDFRFCGSGILFDVNHNGTGRDLSRFDSIVVDLDYQGPARQLKIALKNLDRRYADPNTSDTTKPNVLTVPVTPGHNRLILNPADFAVEPWWAAAHKTAPDADKPQIDNVVAIDLQTAQNPALGHYDFRLREISLSGASVTSEHWYLVLLGIWTGVAALYLAYRVVRMKRAFAARQQHLFAESRHHAEARHAAESASQAKSRFLAHMSHELRTPLNAILGYAQILKASALTDRQSKAANTIQQSGEHLLALITDILDLSRIEAGKLELVPHPIDIRRTVRAVTDMMAVRAQEKHIVFHETVAADVPRGVIGDDKCLRQVLINLAGNAVKFTDQGEVRLLVTSVAAAGGDVRLRFEAHDTGPGIAPDQVEAIFEPFEQVGDRSRRAGGTGLGLSISRRIVDLMGGELRVESTPGVGSRFWFELELPLADSNALPVATQLEPEAARPRLERVVVDAVPSAAAMDRLHRAAKAGNMRSVRAEAERLVQHEPHTRAFAEEVLGLARAYQSRALLEFIEHHKQESATVCVE